MQVGLTRDRNGLPGIVAADDVAAFFGLGALHGHHRPFQSLILPCAGQGRLMERLAPVAALEHLDTIAHRLDLPERGRAVAAALDPWTAARVDAYLEGLARGVARSEGPWALRFAAERLRVPDAAALASGFLLSAYLGLAEGQERMERLLVEALGEGADPALLEAMFAPHLRGWSPGRLARLPSRRPGPGFAAHALGTVGGSNAWALGPAWTASGGGLLAGDPHLQINQMPALFFEVRAKVGEDYWLGATIPGLPGLAVGRNRRVAWSGTFAVADNVDFFIETMKDGAALGPKGPEPVLRRQVEINRRFRAPMRLSFVDTPRGSLEDASVTHGEVLSTAWAGVQGAAEAMQAYLRLPSAKSAAEADRILDGAHTLSLHFVLADRDGDVRYHQVGRIPRRTHGWSGLWPAPVGGPRWDGVLGADLLPRDVPLDGMVVSANEARPGVDGRTLSTLAQPEYRRGRITERLRARDDHDVASMVALQQDLQSMQAKLLAPRLLAALPTGPLARALSSWDHRCDVASRGAHAFQIAYRAVLSGLAADLGGAWFDEALNRTEVSVWWCSGLDRLLADPATWRGSRGRRLARRLAGVAGVDPAPWGQVQQLDLPHMVLGGLPDVLGYDRGPFPLPGSLATVCQGNLVPSGGAKVAVGPAYRFVTELGEDTAMTGLPGGIADQPGEFGYDRFLSEYLEGGRHRLAPPAADEARWWVVDDASGPSSSRLKNNARGI